MIPVRIFRQPLLSPHFSHVLPISCDCLAPPHIPESRIERLIPLCIYSPHLSVDLCEFVICVWLFLFLIGIQLSLTITRFTFRGLAVLRIFFFCNFACFFLQRTV